MRTRIQIRHAGGAVERTRQTMPVSVNMTQMRAAAPAAAPQVNVSIHGAKGQPEVKSTRRGQNVDIEVMLDRKIRSAIAKDMADGGPMMKSVSKRFGLNPIGGVG